MCITLPLSQEEQSREEDRQKRLGEQRRKLEAEQAVAANQFLSLFGEVSVLSTGRPILKLDTFNKCHNFTVCYWNMSVPLSPTLSLFPSPPSLPLIPPTPSCQMIDDEGEEKEATDGKDSKKSEVKRDTTHAPDLLEGPSVDHISEFNETEYRWKYVYSKHTSN